MEDIELVFNKCYKYIKSYALSLCFDEALAEEITQETFYKALLNIDKFKGECQIETWLCRIARNVFISLAKKRNYENIDDYTALSSLENIAVNVDDKDIANRILQLSTELPTPYKEVFYMKALGEVSFSVIAEVFSKTESWARVTYFRARKMIFEQLDD